MGVFVGVWVCGEGFESGRVQKEGLGLWVCGGDWDGGCVAGVRGSLWVWVRCDPSRARRARASRACEDLM